MTAPTPDERKTAIAAVFDRASETYDNVGVDFFTAIGTRLVDRVALRPGEHVLDLGCGRGAVTFAAADAVGAEGHVLGIDLAPGMVRRAAEDAARRGVANVEFRVGDAESPDVPDAAYDVVLLGVVIFFLPDPGGALRTYRRLLRDGGRLGLTTFPAQPDTAWTRAQAVVLPYLPGGGPPPNRPASGPLATPESLAAALRDTGFAAVESHAEVVDVEFRDREQWWAWGWSHGLRAALERIPPDQYGDVQRECLDLLAEEVRTDGTLLLHQHVTTTVATA